MGKFYVYEHWRPDTDACFYVGKGNGNRARSFQRNRHYNFVAKKLARLGLLIDVRMVQEGLTELDAFAMEKARIALWRSRGIKLANQTDGGDGLAGWKPPSGWAKRLHTEEVRKKVGLKLRGKKRSLIAIEKTRVALAGRSLPESQRVPDQADREGPVARSRVSGQGHGCAFSRCYA